MIVESRREIGGRTERETRLYITSLTVPAASLGPIVRSHWAVENSLHWVMDMVFRDDECRVRTDNAPANFTTLKHIDLTLTRKAPAKDSLPLKRNVAAWDDDYSLPSSQHDQLTRVPWTLLSRSSHKSAPDVR